MQALYMQDCYLKEFETTVKSVSDGKFIVLENTAFYPNSGGQPYDTGVLEKDDEKFRVVFTGKFSGNISHEVDHEGLKPGDKVKGKIDWDRRYVLMRFHTASHVLSGVIHHETGAEITGNQISEEKTRVDFSLKDFDREKIKEYEKKANEVIAKGLDVNIKILPREEAFKIPSLVKLRMQLPETIKEIRVVEIKGFDRQACAGTHIKNLSEIKGISIIKVDNKGKNNRRVYFKLK